MSLKASANDDLHLGIELFETGEFEEAVRILEPLAKNDNAEANYYLGLIHDPEFNKPPFSKKLIKYDKKNELLTKSYYKEAFKLGNNYAAFHLGKYYQSMLQKRQKWKHGVKIWRQAKIGLQAQSLEGDWLAKYMLTRISEDRPHTKLLAMDAMVAIEKAAKNGERQAQLYLGRSLSQWLCRTDECKNYPEAFAWFLVSSSQGSYHAKHHLTNLMKIMSKSELVEGKTIAADYLILYKKNKLKK